HRWRNRPETNAAQGLEPYEDEPGFCRSASLGEVRGHGHVLTPGRYVGATEEEDDGVSFEERFAALHATLTSQFEEGQTLEKEISRALSGLRHGACQLSDRSARLATTHD